MSEEEKAMSEPGDETSSSGRKKIATYVGVAAAVSLLLYVLPIPIGYIEVVGSRHITVADVKATGNLREPINIFSIRTGELERRLASDLRIESADVSYTLPLTLTVTVKDRAVRAVVPTRFGYAGIDGNGTVVTESATAGTQAVPILSGIRLDNVLLGDTVTDPGVLHALTYLNALSENGLAELAEMNVGDANALVAYTTDGLQVRVGSADDLPAKAVLTEDMIKDLRLKRVQAVYIDVNVAAPFIKE